MTGTGTGPMLRKMGKRKQIVIPSPRRSAKLVQRMRAYGFSFRARGDRDVDCAHWVRYTDVNLNGQKYSPSKWLELAHKCWNEAYTSSAQKTFDVLAKDRERTGAPKASAKQIVRAEQSAQNVTSPERDGNARQRVIELQVQNLQDAREMEQAYAKTYRENKLKDWEILGWTPEHGEFTEV